MPSAPRASFACLIAAFTLLFSITARSQSNVNEGAETATIYVDAVNGNDNNNGSKTAPVRTIEAGVKLAMANNAASVGSKVIINPGTYREAVLIQQNRKSTTAPMTFQAATNGTAIVSGADVITGWNSYKGSSSVYDTAWPYNFGLCQPEQGAPSQQDIMLHQEMLIVNGTPLTQVLAMTSLLPGTFYVDTSHSIVYMNPPAGTDVATATVETATRPTIWNIFGQSNIVVRGLTFQYANSCPLTGAVSVGERATNLLFDTDTFVWNNAMGIYINTAQNFTVQNSVAEFNGQVGYGSHEVKNTLWQNNVTQYNNWRGAQSAFYVWDRGGAKWMLDHDSTYKNITSNYNLANGVFWDTDNENITYTGSVSAMNLVNDMQIEKTQGPITVANSYLCYANLLGVTHRGGIAVRNSEGITLSGATLYGSLSDQFVVVGNAGGIEISNWETGQTYNLITQNFTASGNTFSGPSASVFSDSYLGGADWNAFVSSVKSNNNTFWNGSTSNGFVVPSPKAGNKVTLAGWQGATGQDKSSTWTSTSQPAACNIASQVQDFWITSSSYNGVAATGGQATIDVQTFGLGGISGNVSLSVDGISAVPGLHASLSTAPVPVSGNAVLTLTTSSSTPSGTYPITILGTLGNITRTVTISLFVQ
jgi:hypothetical protein